MTTTFNAAATKTVGVNATNFAFTFTRLERIAFGPGKITTLGAELERMGATRALVATGKTLGASPLLERVSAAIGPHCAGVFAGVGQHVPASSVRALVAEGERVGADALVAFGGGSPIDACKVAAASLLNRRDMTPVAGKIDFDGASRAGSAGREIRLVAVPTTLSAGEFTPGGGVTDKATRVKRIVADARLQHRTVIYDPDLCLNTPDWLWVATGMRALDHAIEGIYSTHAQPFTDTLGADAIRLMMAHLPGSVCGGPTVSPSAAGARSPPGTPTSVGSVRGWACRTRSATRSGRAGTCRTASPPASPCRTSCASWPTWRRSASGASPRRWTCRSTIPGRRRSPQPTRWLPSLPASTCRIRSRPPASNAPRSTTSPERSQTRWRTRRSSS